MDCRRGVLAAVIVGAAMFWTERGRSPAAVATDPRSGAAAASIAEHVGGKICAECHAKQFDAWRGSDHDLAMQVADEKSVLGNFADARFTYAGTTSRLFRRDGKFYVNTDGPDGKLADYEIKYTFGVRPLQQSPRRVPRLAPAAALHRLGFAAEGRRRPALVPSLSRAEHQGRRSAALDGLAAELELPVRGVPLDQSPEKL
jgi:hypothetical protein